MVGVTLVGIANDGVRIYIELRSDGKLYSWGETGEGEHVELESYQIERHVDKELPSGEHPADVVTYKRSAVS